MDTKALDSLIDKFINWNGRENNGIDNYSHAEFLEILEELKTRHEELRDQAIRHNVRREKDIHHYVLTFILEALIGKMKYGKRN